VGAAWVFARSDHGWVQQDKLVGAGIIKDGVIYQGCSVALSGDGDTAIVGGYGDNSLTGATWVFVRAAGKWRQQDKLVAVSGTEPVQQFQGKSVSLSHDGNIAVVGAPYDNSRAGAAYVFERSGTTWRKPEKLVGSGAVSFVFKRSSGSLEGTSVGLSHDGNIAAIGGPGEDGGQGAVSIFTRSGDGWTQQERLIGTGAVGRALLGSSVSLSGDGNIVLAGATSDNDNVGAAWAFSRSRTVWTEVKKFVGSDFVQSGPYVFQGGSVSLSGNGDTALIGGAQDNRGVGATWAFRGPCSAE
jgi:hypothetical protein